MKPKPKALTAALFLAVTSGPAGAVIRTSDNGALFLTTVSPGNVVSYTRDIGITMDSFLSGRAGLYANLSADSVRNTYSAAAPDSNRTASAGGSVSAITTVTPGTSAATIQGTTQLRTGVRAAANGRIAAVNALPSSAADESSFSPTGTNAFALNNDDASKANLSWQVSSNQHGTVGTPVANGSSGSRGPATANQFLERDGSAAAKFNLTPNGPLSASTTAPVPGPNVPGPNVPEPNVPEPNNWAMLLAGLLGAGAIARRRMSS